MSDLKQLINKAINNHEQANPKPLPKRKSDDQLSAEKTRPTKQASLDPTPIMFNNDKYQPRPKALRVPITQLSNILLNKERNPQERCNSQSTNNQT